MGISFTGYPACKGQKKSGDTIVPPDFSTPIFQQRRMLLPREPIPAFNYMPTTAPNQDCARETGPPVTTSALARLANAHSRTTAPVTPMVTMAPLEISACTETAVCSLVLVLAAVLVVVVMVFLLRCSDVIEASMFLFCPLFLFTPHAKEKIPVTRLCRRNSLIHIFKKQGCSYREIRFLLLTTCR
jgi:hypothetical protein